MRDEIHVQRACDCGLVFWTDCGDRFCSDGCEERAQIAAERAEERARRYEREAEAA
jgi:hypothetical protein